MGIRHRVQPVDIDETPIDGESAETMSSRLAAAKANAIDDALPVLGSDTVVALDAIIFGKPTDEADAIAMLERLSGRTHQVLTAVALRAEGETRVRISSTDVTFRPISALEARRYWATGEPADKAGAYGIQGLGGVFVRHISGSYSGVMGLPVFETAELLREAGIQVP